ncbi:sulfotransferase domain-containing protein [bacterium]|nr:sulfotransferase domain-containing protein [bacterium]
MSLYVFFVVCCTFLQAYEYPHRELDRPIINAEGLKYEHFAILSPPRTGSTLTYAITQYLLETRFDEDCSLFSKEVSKHHDDQKVMSYMNRHAPVLAIIPIRDPFEALASYIKIYDEISEELVSNLANAVRHNFLCMLEFLEAANKDNVLLVRYEEFVSDHKVLIDSICSKLGVEISKEERERASLLFSKQNVKKYTSEFKVFSQHDPVTHFHGNHISKNQKSLKELVSVAAYNDAVKKLNDICKKFGYPERELLK